jgi:predicted Rossmann fold nucleotide-binding protein DprA/Smf involved in DNA uptake
MSEDIVRARFGKIWPVHVESFTRLLIEGRAACGGDLDLLLILAVIGDRSFSSRHADATLSYERFQSSPVETPREDINIRSIAAFSGIPRETVRRKLAQLEKKGWVMRKGDHFIEATEKVKHDLAPLTLATLRYLGRIASVMREPEAE